MKKCSKCKENKGYSEFYKNRARSDGYCNYCKICDKVVRRCKEKRKEYEKKYRLTKKEYIKEKNKKIYKNNKEIYDKRNKKWAEENRERMRELWRKYSRTEKSKKRHKYQQAKRRAVQLNATLPGYDDEIKEIYENCPKGYHVDHIYPLLGKNFRGLHVPWNLQYLTAEENFKKNNKSPEEYNND